MSTHEPIINHFTNSGTTKVLKHLANAFQITLPCVLCLDKLVKVREIYSLLDFDDLGGILNHTVLFWYGYQTGFVVTIVVLELKTGELLKRSHRIDNDVCNWVIIEYDFLNRTPKTKEQILNDSHDSN